ncbi:muramoyltetrapeptide carboxypeptidase [bacterium A37T11]|nr:muramoyltetrapeptide carboxypeptidase [bacterium A37T11]
MDKRNFLRHIGMGILGAPLLGASHAEWLPASPKRLPLVLPPALKKGDTVGMVCPSSLIVEEVPFKLAQETFEAMGLRVKWGGHVHSRYGQLAGRDEERLADLHVMFADPEVKAIVCMRGGSGAARLLDKLDYDLIRKHPKIFIGYSDITALLNAIYVKTGLITFHGPVGISSWPLRVVDQFNRLFFERQAMTYENPVEKGNYLIARENRTLTITPGVSEGRLLGGNLSVLTGIAGSPYYPDFTDSILFLEEVEEDLYRVERMFSQLKLSGALHQIKGFIFGQCTDCKPEAGYGTLSFDEILDDYIKPLGIPAYQGAMIGHISEQFILPVGASIRMDAARGSFSFTENIFS